MTYGRAYFVCMVSSLALWFAWMLSMWFDAHEVVVGLLGWSLFLVLIVEFAIALTPQFWMEAFVHGIRDGLRELDQRRAKR